MRRIHVGGNAVPNRNYSNVIVVASFKKLVIVSTGRCPSSMPLLYSQLQALDLLCQVLQFLLDLMQLVIQAADVALAASKEFAEYDEYDEDEEGGRGDGDPSCGLGREIAWLPVSRSAVISHLLKRSRGRTKTWPRRWERPLADSPRRGSLQCMPVSLLFRGR